MGWLGGLGRWLGVGRRDVSVHGEILPGGDTSYHGQQMSLDPIQASDYRDMLRDATVASALEVRITGMLPGFQLLPAGDDPGSLRALDCIERALSQMCGSPLGVFSEVAREGLTYGFTVAEPVWMLAPGGLWTLRALKCKRAESLQAAIQADEYGNIEGLRMAAPGAPAFVPASEFVFWRWRGGWYEVTGKSALYEAYDPWRSKTIFARAWAIYLSRHGQGILKWSMPPDRYNAGEISRIKEIMQNLQTGSGIALRSGIDTLEMLESSGSPGTIYQQYYLAMDKAITRAILYQELATGEGARVGSYAASETQADVMWAVLRRQGEAYLEEMREQVGRRILDRNGYPELPVPIFVPEPVAAPPSGVELLSVLSPAVQSGVLPPLTPEQAQGILAQLGISPAIQEADRNAGAIATPRAGMASGGYDETRHRARLAAAADLRRDFDRADEAAAQEIADEWAAAVPEIMDRIGRVLWDTRTGAWKSRQPGVIRDAVTNAIKARGQDIRNALVRHLERRYTAGRDDAKADLARRRRRAKAAVAVGTVEITPTQALEALRQGAYLVLQRRYGQIAESLYYSIYRAVRGDLTIRDAAAMVQEILDTEGLNVGQSMTIVRTEMARAFNEGRLSYWSEAETADRYTTEPLRIIGYRWNSILDDVTTDECRERDGRVFAPGEVDIPPIHFGCRSVIEPIYSDDGEDVDALPWTTRSQVPVPGFMRSRDER